MNDIFWKSPSVGNNVSCTSHEISGVVEEAMDIACNARLFCWRPDGMTQVFKQDVFGVPVRTLQDPLNYPYGSLFLAPGPLSQVLRLPEDSAIREEIRRANKRWNLIQDKYNFCEDIQRDCCFTEAFHV